jgi:hypothetical protein
MGFLLTDKNRHFEGTDGTVQQIGLCGQKISWAERDRAKLFSGTIRYEPELFLGRSESRQKFFWPDHG